MEKEKMNIFNGIWLTVVGLIVLLYEYKILPFAKEKKAGCGRPIKILGFAK